MNSAADVWKMVLSLMEKDLTPIAIKTWFDDSYAVELTDTALIVCIPSEFKYNIISARYVSLVEKSLFELFGTRMNLNLLNGQATAAHPQRRPTQKQNHQGQFISEDFSFDSFVVGSTNQLAFNAAIAVAEEPGIKFNPLFIYGHSGLGKTHLLCAIGNRLKQTHPDLKICYVKGDQFTNELVKSIGSRKNDQFHEKYRECDLLLMDDVQFIAGKKETQEEFFHTFNALYEAKKQIVLTADRTPTEMNHLEERLCTRFQQGLMADIQAPEYETRMAIVRHKATSMGLELPDGVVEYIATNITSNVRQLEGTVRKLLAHQELMGSHIDINTVIRCIKDIIRTQGEFAPSPDEIIEETAKFYGFEPQDLKSRSQSKDITLARQVSMYLIRHITTTSLKETGKVYGRDHTTVMHAVDKISTQLKEDRRLAECIKDITANINARND